VKPAGGRVDWASLPRRICLEDVLACPSGGRRRSLADIGQRAQRDAIVAMLALTSILVGGASRGRRDRRAP
jgi:hypothetical protein